MAEQVKIFIGADPGPGIKGVKKFQEQSKKQFNKFEGNAKKSSNRVLDQFKKLGLGISAALLARAAIRGFDTIIKKIDQIGKLSIRLGETTEFLSEMGFVAARAGVSWQSLSVGIQRANRRIAEAAQGTGEAINPLRELGLLTDVQNGKFKSFEAILPILSDRIRALTSDQDKLRIAFKLFDTEGVSFLQFLKDGSAGIAAVREQGKKFGVTIDKDVAAKAAKAADALTNMNTALDALARDAAISAAGSVETLATKLSELLVKIRAIKKEGGIKFNIGRSRVTVGGPDANPFGGLFGNVSFSSEGGSRNRDRDAAEAEAGLRKFPGESQKDFKARVASKIAGFGKGDAAPVVVVKLTDDEIARKLILQQTVIIAQMQRSGIFQTNLLAGREDPRLQATGTAARIRNNQRHFARIDGIAARNQFIQDRGFDLMEDTVEATQGWEIALQGVEGILQRIILDFESIDSFTKSFGKQLFSEGISLAFRALVAQATGGGSEVALSAKDFLGKSGPGPGGGAQFNITTTRDIDLDFFTRVIAPLNNQFVRNGGTLRASTIKRT